MSDSDLNDSGEDYIIEFLNGDEYSVQFQAAVMGEKLGKTAQVSIDVMTA